MGIGQEWSGRGSACQRLVGVVTLAVVLAGCSAAASPSASGTDAAATTPTPTPSATPTPTPIATPTPTPVATVDPDPASDLAIGTPYEIQPADPAIAQSLAFTSFIDAIGGSTGVWQVTLDGVGRAFVVVMWAPPGTYEMLLPTLVGSLEEELGAKVTLQQVAGVDVRTISKGTQHRAVFQRELDTIIVVIGRSAGDLLPVTKSLVASNP